MWLLQHRGGKRYEVKLSTIKPSTKIYKIVKYCNFSAFNKTQFLKMTVVILTY